MGTSSTHKGDETMTKPDFKALSPYELYELYCKVADNDALVEDSQSPDWRERLIAGVHYANDRRAAGGLPSDAEWAEAVCDVINIY
jgi:hypothetical protein